MEQQYETISKFDRAYGGLVGGNNLKTNPTTIKNVNSISGESETFILQTVRGEERKKVIKGLDESIVVTVGDYIVIEYLSKDGHQRLILPPKVAEAIERQHNALSARSRSNASKAAMRQRIAAGYRPTPPKRKKAK